MSTARYNLRKLTKGKQTPMNPPRTTDNAVSDTEEVARPSAGTTRRYSDVVAARPPSPPLDGEESPLNSRVDVNASVEQNNIIPAQQEIESSELTSSEEDERSWTTVKPRRSRSLESLAKIRKAGKKITFVAPLKKSTTAKDPVIEAARSKLTSAEQTRISKRYEKVVPKPTPQRERSTSRGEGPSKGKQPDPRNWGSAGLEDVDLDPQAQRDALATWNKVKSIVEEHSSADEPDAPSSGEPEMPPTESTKKRKRSRTRRHHEKESREIKKLKAHIRELENPKTASIPFDSHQESATPSSSRAPTNGERRQQASVAPRTSREPELLPVKQIATKSYLGKALQAVGSKRRSKHKPVPSDSSSSSSSSSSDSPSTSSDSDSSSESSSGSSSSSSSGSKNKRRKRSKKRSHRRTRKTKTTLKPIPPTEYDGTADARSYHRFVTEGTAYVKDGHVQKRRRPFVLSYYLKDTAYDFYTQKVSMNSEEWSLQQFFEGLFNYCFPIDYRMKQREKLRKCWQNDKTVSKFIHELEELYNMIGMVDERDKVIKLWDGLSAVIQRGLWRDGLNPDISTWEDVRERAQIIELSEGVSDRFERRKKGADNAPRPSTSNDSSSKSFNGKRSGSNNHGFSKPRDNRRRDDRPNRLSEPGPSTVLFRPSVHAL